MIGEGVIGEDVIGEGVIGGDLNGGNPIDFVTGVPMTMPTAPTAVPVPSYNFAENKLPVHVDLSSLFTYLDGRFERMQESIDSVKYSVESVANRIETVENDVESVGDRIDSAENDLESKDGEMTLLQKSLESLKKVGPFPFLFTCF